ncbi:hypothetical protein HOY82DRAFT_17915 [Tuber indicum]|nr:hypothetical protein HOY82DRAFT_17915 [Tuber indicum]
MEACSSNSSNHSAWDLFFFVLLLLLPFFLSLFYLRSQFTLSCSAGYSTGNAWLLRAFGTGGRKGSEYHRSIVKYHTRVGYVELRLQQYNSLHNYYTTDTNLGIVDTARRFSKQSEPELPD